MTRTAAFETVLAAALALAPLQAILPFLRAQANAADRNAAGGFVRQTQQARSSDALHPRRGGVPPTQPVSPGSLPPGAPEKSRVERAAAGNPAEAPVAAEVQLVEASEPGTLVLLGAGLLALFAWSRRQHARRQRAARRPRTWPI